MLTTAFENLSHEKRSRIINAALREFAEYGYEQASTNRIVKQAGIGKGMLFYYFQNKSALYQYLINHSIDILMNKYINLIDAKDPDFIQRIKQSTEIKMKAFSKHPDVFHFMGTLLLNDEYELPEDLEKKIEKLKILSYSMLYDNIDTGLFHDHIDPNKAFHLMRWFIDGYQNDVINRLKGKKMTEINWDPYFEEFYEYLGILKKAFYK